VSHLKDIVFDCTDAWPLAHWWAEVLGYRVDDYTDEDIAQLRAEGIERVEDDPNVCTRPVDGNGPAVWFCEVPEAKTTKNRVHLDVFADVDELVERGAKIVERHPRWTVMADPEGNEFCAFPPPPPER
jgi:hypothetical protein